MSFFDDIEDYENPVPPGVKLPTIDIPDKYYKELGIDTNVSNYEFLRQKCLRAVKEFGIDKLSNKQDYYDRVKYELGMFEELGFVDYILLNWFILKYCHENDIPTGYGRGSAPSSLILYLLVVTRIDPIEHNLYFERFVSKARAKKIISNGEVYLDGGLLADVDSDIAYDRRQEVIQYVKETFKGKVCNIANLSTLSSKICIKECGKIVGDYSEEDMNEVSDLIPKSFGKSEKLEKSREESEKFDKWCKSNEFVYFIAKKLEGLIKNTSVHASGIAISFYDVEDIMPMQKAKSKNPILDGQIVSCYDMNWVAELVVKFDILGLKTLTVANDVCKRNNIDFDSIDVNSPDIYEWFQNYTSPEGLFQISAETNFKVCQKVRPKNLAQMAAVVSIARPGALAYTDDYVKFVETGESQSKHSFFDSVLSETGNIPLYQEQMMAMAKKIGFSLEEADMLRKIVGKKQVDKMPAWEQKIKDKIKENNLDEEVGDVLWRVAKDSANYSFNKCIFEEESVETEKGRKMLTDVSIGDRVLSYDVENNKDHYVEVIDKIRGEREVYEVELHNGKTIRCSLDHKFLTKSGKMKTLKQIISDDDEIACEN